VNLRDLWRKITGSSEPPDTRQTEIHDPLTEAPNLPDEAAAAERDLRSEEIDRRTLQDEEIL
jgi:hypothetical protein